MKKSIHPKYVKIRAVCSCGNIMSIFSTLVNDISLDICNVCHPFYTGKQRIIDSSGRVNKFNRNFSLLK
ncbi:50S ribosomal protein L31 [Candidatus Westeberhardia cardiocondylae]|uniref:Large ribosomal subunit protein bL31 n=1 Tax=Candidatus Westeberhardia cardiocondylae TaxID=1594731 RepID=A0A0H5BWK2_9ENTR|nr:50S ribosomal protein L31 [Candidatus Westeberhardia cardiocondylae]CEN32102.1 50S ribosomal protein L31 [Candidatus Westeberhardia cardiocondylae]